MDYETVYLKEKIVTGIKIRTNNNDPTMKTDKRKRKAHGIYKC